jgi:NAD(P)-dependent dehydrogenase (short-subunit alcohol dehydrogenase family)
MNGKQVLITGATDGIGKATALAIAKSGATVVLVGRNPEKSQQVIDEIRAETYNKNLHLLIADLSSQAQIRQLAETYRSQFGRLDVLVNNAGGYFSQRQETVDGIELTFALNHLAYFMLTGLLMDVLLDTGQQTGDARIVNVSSDAHEFKRKGIPFDDLQNTNNYNSMKAYSLSKLANVMFTYELAKRLKNQPVTANVLHPGFVQTGFTRNSHGLTRKFFSVTMRLLATSPEKGAKTSVYLATSDNMRGVSGQYFLKSKPKDSHPASYDESQWKRLWDISLEMTGLPDFPVVTADLAEA